MNEANAEMTNAIAEQDPSPVEPLSSASIIRGAAHYRLAASVRLFLAR